MTMKLNDSNETCFEQLLTFSKRQRCDTARCDLPRDWYCDWFGVREWGKWKEL